jgi:hypothetical protein
MICLIAHVIRRDEEAAHNALMRNDRTNREMARNSVRSWRVACQTGFGQLMPDADTGWA